MKMRLVVSLLLICGSFQESICAAAEEVGPDQIFQEHRTKMGPVFGALLLRQKHKEQAHDCNAQAKMYNDQLTVRRIAAYSYLRSSQDMLGRAFWLCPCSERRRDMLTFTAYHLNQAKALLREGDWCFSKFRKKLKEEEECQTKERDCIVDDRVTRGGKELLLAMMGMDWDLNRVLIDRESERQQALRKEIGLQMDSLDFFQGDDHAGELFTDDPLTNERVRSFIAAVNRGDCACS